MKSVLLPQAVTIMLPAIVSQLVVIVKDTALGGVLLNFSELLGARRTLAANFANVIPSFIVVAIIFILVNLMLTSFASWLERRLRQSKRGTGAVLGPDVAQDGTDLSVFGASAAAGVGAVGGTADGAT
jgi:glutamate transport system permease protein